MKKFVTFLFSIFFVIGAVAAKAQVFPTASDRRVSLTAGGMASAFQPDFVDNLNSWGCAGGGPSCPTGPYYPLAGASKYKLFGVGAYVDVKLSRWVQLEGEARWLRYNQYNHVYQDNYLIGPRLPVYRFWKATVYGKALGGMAKMNFDPGGDNGTFTDVALGGGADVRLSKRLSIRLADFEYQYWPTWSNSKLSPYGVSVGFGYKIF
jgi:hypothetical protein